MHDPKNTLILIKKEIQEINPNSQLIVVTKTFGMSKILPIIETGHNHFGENKVQEAVEKWEPIKAKNKNIKLHLIGKLQTNKVKYVIPLFDYIHSLDNQKLADVLGKHQLSLGRSLKYFIQVNIANEIQKSGIPVSELDGFYNYCVNEVNLQVVGLMIIPPNDNNSVKYFQSVNELNKSLGLKDLSMGMSADYLDAVKFGSNFVRIGSSIFGQRS